jgi:nucleoside-triphosphatase THEP1
MIDEQLLSKIHAGLSTKVGKGKAITSKEIVSKLKERGFKIDGAILREHIHELRMRGHFICGDSSGYYLAANQIEAKKQISSLSSSRIKQQQEVLTSLQKTYTNLFKQESLF